MRTRTVQLHHEMMMMMMMMKRRERRRQRDGEREERDGKRKKQRERHQTLMLLRKRLSRSQSVACAEVQAGAVKALAGCSIPKKKTCLSVRLFGPCLKTGRKETRKKTRACELVHHKPRASGPRASKCRLQSAPDNYSAMD